MQKNFSVAKRINKAEISAKIKTVYSSQGNGDNTKSGKVIAALVGVVAVLAVVITVFAVLSGKVGKVTDFKMAKNTVSSITLSWSSAKNADGYRIFALNQQTGTFEPFEDVSSEGSESACSYSIDKLKGGTQYSLKIAAFKYEGNEKVFGDMSEHPVFAYTIPDKPKISYISGISSSITFNWSKKDNATAYRVQYSSDSKFSQNNVVDDTVSVDKGTKYTAENVPPQVYYVRICAYIKVNAKKVYGEWSDVAKVNVVKTAIDPDKPMIALSFDDGPGFAVGGGKSPTAQILDVLEKYNARATFFMVASRLSSSNKSLLKRELDLGCELGNHTYSHDHYGKSVTAKDIKKCSDKIKKLCGQAPTVFRCPGGIITSTIRKECRKKNMPIAYWSVDTEDWASKNPKKIYKKVKSGAYDGAIILCHDIYPTTAKAVKKFVPYLVKNGYQIVTVSELIRYKTGNPAKPGDQYVDYKTVNNNTH